MVEIKNKNIEIEKIEPNPHLDLSLFKKKGTSRTFKGWIIIKMNEARKNENFEVAGLLQFIYKKYSEYETSEKVILKSWKGKSGIKCFNEPDKIIVITYQKFEENETPKEIRDEIDKSEINKVIVAINKLKDEKNRIPTSKIAEEVYKIKWKELFATRPEHIRLTHILGALNFYGIINYSKRGITSVIKEVREIQEILPK